MNRAIVLLAGAVMLLTTVRAAENEPKGIDREKVVKNLLYNLDSGNKGVRESSAFMLGELRYEEGIIPLLAMLHNDPNESTRIVAALSLSKIGGGRGTFAVKQAVRFDESPRVRLVCAWFANLFTNPKPFEIIRLEDAVNLQIAAQQIPE